MQPTATTKFHSSLTMEQNFQYWVFLTLFSIVNLTSLTNSFKERGDDVDLVREERWVLSVAAISLILSLVACGSHMAIHDKFCGQRHELVLVSR